MDVPIFYLTRRSRFLDNKKRILSFLVTTTGAAMFAMAAYMAPHAPGKAGELAFYAAAMTVLFAVGGVGVWLREPVFASTSASGEHGWDGERLNIQRDRGRTILDPITLGIVVGWIAVVLFILMSEWIALGIVCGLLAISYVAFRVVGAKKGFHLHADAETWRVTVAPLAPRHSRTISGTVDELAVLDWARPSMVSPAMFAFTTSRASRSSFWRRHWTGIR